MTAHSGASIAAGLQALPADIGFLATAGLERRALEMAARVASRKNLAASEVLIHRKVIARDDYEHLLARHVGAGYEPDGPDPALLDVVEVDSASELRAAGAIERNNTERGRLFVSPQASGYDRVAAMAARAPDTFRGAVFTGRMALRRSLFERDRAGYAERAVNDLARNRPEFSASRRLGGIQVKLALSIVLLVGIGVLANFRIALFTCVMALSLFYFAIVFLRAMLIAFLDAVTGTQGPRLQARAPEDYPVYSVLVALKGEAGQVANLVQALDRLDWPATKKEVFLVCEEDDPDTISAIRRLNLPEGFELVICPPCLPRTKPKALQFALPLCSGEFTVIYDAEDRPHRLQLREAFEKLLAGGERLACVQAPLLIHNSRQNWLTRMFAIEYHTQFLGTLPVLEMLRAPLALGGTSNHFRTDLLRAAGGWDPFNVTEDADLGIRLARHGYGCGTISSPTWEEAPPVTSVWMKQRTRWLKGWLQTVLVHSRRPWRTARELGPTGAILFHLTITAIVVSMLIHPFFLVQLLWELGTLIGKGDYPNGPFMLGVSVFNLVGGYTTYGFLAYSVHKRLPGRTSPLWLFTLPVYWLLISLAGWRALYQLIFDPFRWEKTPHGLAKSGRNDNI